MDTPASQRSSADNAHQFSPTSLEQNNMHRSPLAIVGIGCRFPGGADNPTSFWRLLCDGVDAIRDLSERFLFKARERFQAFPFVDYKKLDLEQDPLEQGFAPHSFDVDLRPSYPLLTLPNWKKVLEEAEYSDVLEGSGNPESSVRIGVLVARAPQKEADSQPASPTTETAHTDSAAQVPQDQADAQPPTQASWLIFADRGGIGENLAERLRLRHERIAVMLTTSQSQHRRDGIIHDRTH